MRTMETAGELDEALAAHGLLALGTNGTLALVGNAGAAMWRAFSRGRRGEPNPLDAWTRRVVEPSARKMGARAAYPFDDPPPPFVSWSRSLDISRISPIGLAIYSVYGFWHAYRAALLWNIDGKARASRPSGRSPDAADRSAPLVDPCTSCSAPCLSTCPVGAFTVDGYDVAACKSHVATVAGWDCLEQGCRARRTCPVRTAYRYDAEQARFHIKAFAGSTA